MDKPGGPGVGMQPPLHWPWVEGQQRVSLEVMANIELCSTFRASLVMVMQFTLYSTTRSPGPH